MTHLFYFGGLLFLIYEIYFLFNVVEKVNNVKEYKEYNKENKGIKYDDMPEDIKSGVLEVTMIGVPYVFWLFVGLLSSQWVLFLLLLIFSFAIVTPLRKLVGFSPIRYVLTTIDTLVCIAVITFIIINKYHLHIDTLSYIKNLFNI